MNCGNFYIVYILFLLTIISAIKINETKSRDVSIQEHIKQLMEEMRRETTDPVLFWNYVMLEACGNDYDNLVVPTPDQNGPGATARAFAIVHSAIHDSMTVFNPTLKSIFTHKKMPVIADIHSTSALNSAITEAAFQTLSFLYPKQQNIFVAVRNAFLRQISSDEIKQNSVNTGIFIGRLVADSILSNRSNDGIHVNRTYSISTELGYHQVDPTHPSQGFLGVHWGNITPFILSSNSQFRPSNKIGETTAERLAYLKSATYLRDFDEIKQLGSKNSKVRTEEQTHVGIAWGYDGVAKLGVPPRLYNQIVRVIAVQKNNTLEKNARLFALVNIALADACFSAWEAKYHYRFWRPIVAIRHEPDRSRADPYWAPFGSQGRSSNTEFTPPFPAYVSGHSTFGSACFEILRRFYKSDTISFQFQSDEFNGRTIDARTGKPRPARSRSYSSFTQAEMEVFMSRLYLGVHWRFDQEQGQILGKKVAQYIYEKLA